MAVYRDKKKQEEKTEPKSDSAIQAKPKTKGIGCFQGGCLLIVIIFVIMLLAAAFSHEDSKSGSSSSTSSTQREKVYNSSWDGSVRQVEEYLDKTLKDPDSFKAIEWSTVQKTNGNTKGFMVRCKYRAKNSFGGYVIENKVFYMDEDGNVLYASDY